MPQEASPALDALRAKLENVKTLYRADASNEALRCLVIGDIGTGKTHLLSTCRLPLLIHNFDPGGTKTTVIRKLIECGDALVTNFVREKWEAPTQFKAWQKEVQALQKLDAFKHFGTYAIDSFTPWQDAMMHQIVKEQRLKAEAGVGKRKPRTGWTPEIQDYLEWMSCYQDMIRDLSTLPCDFIMTAHLMPNIDKNGAVIDYDIAAYNKSRSAVPAAFDEVYIQLPVYQANQVNYRMLTRHIGVYKAKTRIGGGGVFELYEQPNIKRLLKKAGLPYKDKPKLKEVLSLGR